MTGRQMKPCRSWNWSLCPSHSHSGQYSPGTANGRPLRSARLLGQALLYGLETTVLLEPHGTEASVEWCCGQQSETIQLVWDPEGVNTTAWLLESHHQTQCWGCQQSSRRQRKVMQRWEEATTTTAFCWHRECSTLQPPLLLLPRSEPGRFG